MSRKLIITGASGILGSSLARGLSESGYQLCLVDKDEEALDRLNHSLRDSGFLNHQCLKLDIGNEAEVQEILARTQWNDSLYGVINNAAVKPPGFFSPTASYALETWEEVHKVNCNAPFLLVKATLDSLIKNGGGIYLFISSIYGVMGPDNRIYEGSYYEELGGAINTPMAYSSSKAALIGQMKYIATAFGSRNIRANAICPGGIYSGQNETFSKRYSQRVPLGRMANAEDVVNAARFLVDPASDYISGQTLLVDGGLSAW